MPEKYVRLGKHERAEDERKIRREKKDKWDEKKEGARGDCIQLEGGTEQSGQKRDNGQVRGGADIVAYAASRHSPARRADCSHDEG